MKLANRAVVSVMGVASMAVAAPAFAASDVSNDSSVSNTVVASVAAPIASAQTASIISGAIGNALGGLSVAPTGGLGGGFSGGAGGGFSGGTGTGGGGLGGPGGGPAPGNLISTRNNGQNGAALKNFGLWGQGTYVSIHKSEAALGMTGDVANGVVGADYKFGDRVLAGVSVGYESVDIKTKFNNGYYKNDGFTVAPYLGISLTKNWAVDLAAGYSWLSFDTMSNSNTTKGQFDGDRWFVSSGLTGTYAINRWLLSPRLAVSYMRESHDAYTDTSATRVASTEIDFGQLSGGLKVGYMFQGFTPYAKLTGQWDFEKPKAVLKGNGQMSTVDDGGGVGALGIDFAGTGPWSGNIEGSYGSIGRTDLDVWQGNIKLRYQF